MAKDKEYIKILAKDIPTYLEQGWVELVVSPQQQIYDTTIVVNKPRKYTEEQQERRKQLDRERYLANREKYIERAKKWHEENPDRVKELQEARREKTNAKDRERYHNDPEARAKALEAGRKYREAHRDELNKKQRDRYHETKKR